MMSVSKGGTGNIDSRPRPVGGGFGASGVACGCGGLLARGLRIEAQQAPWRESHEELHRQWDRPLCDQPRDHHSADMPCDRLVHGVRGLQENGMASSLDDQQFRTGNCLYDRFGMGG